MGIWCIIPSGKCFFEFFLGKKNLWFLGQILWLNRLYFCFIRMWMLTYLFSSRIAIWFALCNCQILLLDFLYFSIPCHYRGLFLISIHNLLDWKCKVHFWTVPCLSNCQCFIFTKWDFACHGYPLLFFVCNCKQYHH